MTESTGYDPKRRIIGLVVVVALCAIGLVGQLLNIQVLDRDRYVAWGDDQRLRTLPLEGQRGQLLDRNGEELAVSLPQPVVVADPLLVTDPAGAAVALAPVLGRDVAELEALLSTEGRFVYLQRPSTVETADAVADLALDGVLISEEPRRFHPAGLDLGRGVIGLVGVDNTGLSGLELQYEDALAGTPGRLVAERSIDGRTIPDGIREIQPAIQGDDIHLTIERALQFEVERALVEHVESTGSNGGVVVITEPATGDILAMASVTRLDDGSVVTTSDNRAVTWVYEPASVMKAVTFAGVLDAGIADPQTSRVIADEMQIYDDVFTDDELYGTLPMSVTDILVRSSNTGTISWANDLGTEALHANLEGFGFGTSTGLGFPGESAGLLPDLDAWSGTSFATISIGQGIAVTPLQMLAAYNVIANDGVYVAPRLVHSVSHDGGEPEPAPQSPTRRVIDRETAEDVTQMLSSVVAIGTAQRAEVPGYSLAAKTGTARKVQDSGGYEDAAGNFHYVATVAGFFPAEAPEYSMIVILDEPATAIYASQTSAPLFGELAAWTLRHFQVTPATDFVFDLADPADPTDDAAIHDGAPSNPTGADGEAPDATARKESDDDDAAALGGDDQ